GAGAGDGGTGAAGSAVGEVAAGGTKPVASVAGAGNGVGANPPASVARAEDAVGAKPPSTSCARRVHTPSSTVTAGSRAPRTSSTTPDAQRSRGERRRPSGRPLKTSTARRPSTSFAGVRPVRAWPTAHAAA